MHTHFNAKANTKSTVNPRTTLRVPVHYLNNQYIYQPDNISWNSIKGFFQINKSKVQILFFAKKNDKKISSSDEKIWIAYFFTFETVTFSTLMVHVLRKYINMHALKNLLLFPIFQKNFVLSITEKKCIH